MEFNIQQAKILVNIPDMATLEAEIMARFTARAGFALATINLDHLDKLAESAAFRTAYQAQDFVVADGNPIVWLSRLAGRRVDLLPGSELVLPLVRWAAKSGRPVALVGATPDTLASAATVLENAVPGVNICAQIAPEMGFDPAGRAGDAVLRDLKASGAGLALLALGAPKQELFAARARLILPTLGLASIGAGLDFLAGTQKRAPSWVRRIAMEWLWRVALSPGRLAKRYGRSLLALPGHAIRAWRLR